MATTSGLMTFAEFEKLPDPGNGEWYELHHGELVRMTRPSMKHYLLQRKLDELLRPVATDYVVGIEFSFRATPDHEFRIADVAAVRRHRIEAIPEDRHLIGAPELVIEVVSPSNSAEELVDKRLLCPQHGSQEFWVVYPKKHLVEVYGRDGVRTYGETDRLESRLFPGAQISVADLFLRPLI